MNKQEVIKQSYINSKVFFFLSQEESAIVGQICKSRPADFNVFKNSPIVDHYLKSNGSRGEHKTIRIRRNEVLKNINVVGQVTYRQIIQESTKSSRQRSARFKKNQEEIMRERAKIAQDMNHVLAIEHEKATKILKKPQYIKATAEYIIEQYTSRKKGTRVGLLPNLGGR
jgi:hypothetical protein